MVASEEKRKKPLPQADVLKATAEKLMGKVGAYLPVNKITLIQQAYEFAMRAHDGQLRQSGEPYLLHPLSTADILADLQLDAASIAAALLHDVLEDTKTTLDDIKEIFGDEVTTLVDGVTRLERLPWRVPEERVGKELWHPDVHAESLRKMLVAMAEDLRVVFIKLADRLHNMRTLSALTEDKQKRIAQETIEIYAPLAHRIGIWEIKGQLEDLAFSYLNPVEYAKVKELVNRHEYNAEALISKAINVLKGELSKVAIEAEVSGRDKNIYSIYKKWERYAQQGKDFGEIQDILAIRVLVSKISDCYNTIGIIHSIWHPIRGKFDDYIANPKDNGYQSLHTTVMCFGTTPMEIQVKTHEMYRTAEYGVAAHWRYKEGAKAGIRFEERVAWLRQLIEWHRELRGTAEFLESVKTDIFKDQVFVYTPKGEIKELPAGSTPLDFAYRVHTDLGHRCIGAKVNGRLVPLNYTLSNGETVEIMASKSGKGPSRDWLNPNLGYVKSTHGRDKIKQWFKKGERGTNIERGKEILERELRHIGISAAPDEIASLFDFSNVDDLLAALGCGDISPTQLALKLAPEVEKEELLPTIKPVKPSSVTGIQVLGVGDLLTNLARCCNPVPGDEIVGYVTRSRGISVHRKDCPNVINEDEKERLIAVEWGRVDQLYPVAVIIETWSRVGMLRDITVIVAEERINITSAAIMEHADHSATIRLTIEIKGIGQLSRLLSRIEGLHGVFSVARSLDGVKSS